MNKASIVPRAVRLAVVPLLVALAACTARAGADPAVRTQHVTIHWSRFHPAHYAFPAGTTVRFVIHNTDPIGHEFILGSRAVQDSIENTAHAGHDGSVPGQISVPPGATVVTTYTFGKPGKVLLGCHIAGHYAYGMRGSVRVTS